MITHIHHGKLHVHVYDADEFKESEHPRNELGEFTAGSPAEAASKLATAHNIELTNYSQVPAKKAVEAAKSIHNTHSDLIRRFPGIKKLAPYHQVSLAPGTLKGGEAAGMHTTASGFARAHTTIPVSLPTQEMPLKPGWTVTKHSMPSVYRHELGHQIQGSLEVEARNHPDLAPFLFAKADKSKIKKELPEYAMTNKAEHFAEAFSAYTHPDYGKGTTKVDPALEKIFNRILRERD